MNNFKILLLVLFAIAVSHAHATDDFAINTTKLQTTGQPPTPQVRRVTRPYVKNSDTRSLYFKNSANEEIMIGEHYADDVGELLSGGIKIVHLLSYHNGLKKGGGYFKYNNTLTSNNHNGGTILCKSKTYPADWNNAKQRMAWYQKGLVSANGCYERIDSGGSLNVTNFGAKSDGKTVDTFGVKANVAYITALGKHEKPFGRFKIANSVVFPDGAGTVIDDTILIEKSSIVVRGESPASTVIYPNANKNIIEFRGGKLSLYGNGIHDLRIHAPGNAKAGAALKLYRTINFMSSNIMVNGGYIALHTDGVGRIFFDGFLSTQELRSSGKPSYGFLLTGTDRLSGDVYMNGFNAFYTVNNTPVYSMRFEAVDGVYISNLHIHGGWEFEPKHSGTKILASIECSNCYLDTAKKYNLHFKGDSVAYRNFYFTNMFLAGSGIGMKIEKGKSIIENIRLTSGKVYGQKQRGLSIERTNAKDISINEIQFNGNNISNDPNGGDIYSNASSTRVNSSTFKSGGANGTTIKFDSAARYSQIIGGDVSDSSARTKIISKSPTNRIIALSGFINKNSGSASIVKGKTSVRVTHGLDLSAHTDSNLYDVQLTSRSSLTSCGSLSVRNYTPKKFDIFCDTPPKNTVFVSWKLDTE